LSNLDAEIAMLKARRDAAQLAKARAEATKETAQATYDAAMAALMTEFQLDNLGDARATLERLQGDLQAKLDGVAAELDAMEI
jgi:hypothetical protein